MKTIKQIIKFLATDSFNWIEVSGLIFIVTITSSPFSWLWLSLILTVVTVSIAARVWTDK